VGLVVEENLLVSATPSGGSVTWIVGELAHELAAGYGGRFNVS
jgi:hypothetical protein